MGTMTICEHDNGEIGSTLSGTCIKCGADLDKVYIENRLNYIEDRISKLELKGGDYVNVGQKKAENSHGHLMNELDVPTLDDEGDYTSYAKCSNCGAIENTDESILDCPKLR